MTKCKEIRELLPLYMDNELSSSRMEEVKDHLAACDVCKQELAELEMIRQLLADTEEIPLPPEFDERLHKALAECRRDTRSGKNTVIKRISAVAAVFVIGLFAAAMYNNDVTESFKNLSGAANLEMFEEEAPETDEIRGGPKEELSASVDMAAYASYDESRKMNTGRLQDADGGDETAANKNIFTEAGYAEDTNRTDAGSIIETIIAGSTVPSRGDGFGKKERDALIQRIYENQLAKLLAGEDYLITEAYQGPEYVWNFEVSIISVDEKGETISETVYYRGQEGILECLDQEQKAEIQP